MERAFLLTNTLGEIEIMIKREIIMALIDTRATPSVLNSTLLHCPSSWGKSIVQMVGVSNLAMSVFILELITFHLGYLTGKHVFLIIKSTPVHLLGQDFIETHDATSLSR